MKVNYVLMYGTPYLKYREFETFEDVSKFLVNKSIVNYSIFKKLEDKEEIEMIYRDNDIHYLEKENERLNKELENLKKLNNANYQSFIEVNNIINELEKYLDEQVDYMTHHSIERMVAFDCCRHKLQELKGSDKE